MPLNLSKARISTDAQWVTIYDQESDSEGEVLIRPWDNPEFRRLQLKMNQEYRRPAPGRKHIRNQDIPPEIMELIQKRLVLENILVDWRGFVEEEGGPEIPYSKQKATELLEVEELYWIQREIVSASMTAANFRREIEEEDKENLSPALSGNSHTVQTRSGLNS